MSKIISAEEAASRVNDGATLALGCMGLSGWPEELIEALERRFVATGHPRNLYVVQGSSSGDRKERGVTRLGHEGMIRRWMGAHVGFAPKIWKLIKENKIEAYFIPQGVIVNLWREIASKRPGLITKVGLGTFVDPRIEGGKINSCTTEDVFKILEIEGEEYILYKSFPVDVAFIRGTTVDENGNLTMDKESILLEQLQLAQAARNSGGIVIAQAEYLAKAKTLHPKKVKVPGILVDYVVIATNQAACWQTEVTIYEPSFAGELQIPLHATPSLPLSPEKIIGRRAAMELFPNAVVNLGVGMASAVGSVASEEHVSELLTFSTEAGAIGGVPAGGQDFGSCYNAEANIEHNAMFDFIDGGGLDITFLGLGQADKSGNLNVSKLNGRPMGPGGFINITRGAKEVVFTGTFTTDGLEVEIGNGKLHITKEGRIKKFLDTVEQITFSGQFAQGRRVLYITERCVFSLTNGKMTLIETAPGIDIQKDILALMDFEPAISPQLKEMPAGIFREQWGELRRIVEEKSAKSFHAGKGV